MTTEPGQEIEGDTALGEEEVQRFDPRRLPIFIQRQAELDAYIKAVKDGAPAVHPALYLGVTAEHYTSTPCPSPAVTLDVLAYVAANLWKYRDGWPAYQAAWKPGRVWDVFNEIGAPYETPAVVGAYLGQWLCDRIRVDLVDEYGGKGQDYSVLFMFGGHSADAIIQAYPYADPRVELPADHDLMQLPGQGNLLDLLGGGA